MMRYLHAEWTKLRTLPSTGRLLLALVAVTVAVSDAAATVVSCASAGCGYDPAKISLFGIQAGQAVVAILAVAAISGEFGTGLIRTTLAAMPNRIAVLAVKAVLLTGLSLAAGGLAVLGSALAGQRILLGNGFPPALLAFDGPMVRAAVGSVLYLALVALLSLGIATAVRDSAAAIGVVLGLLYLFPAVILMIPDPDLATLLWQISPTTAGLTIQATTQLSGLPLSPWAGLGVLAAWAGAALVTGGLLLRARDA
jgi:ABC-2 type transport system permease protein